MRTRNRNQEACPKHQKQVQEKKRHSILVIQRKIINKYEVKKRMDRGESILFIKISAEYPPACWRDESGSS